MSDIMNKNLNKMGTVSQTQKRNVTTSNAVTQNKQNKQNSSIDSNVSKSAVNYNWEIIPVAKKDINASLWPFLVVRDKGKSSRYDSRSFSKLKESFDNTSAYNSTTMPKLLTRYNVLRTVLEPNASNIVHLFISFDSVYYSLKDDPNVLHGGTYISKLPKFTDIAKVVNKVIIDSDFAKATINACFDEFKSVHAQNVDFNYELNYIKQLENAVRLYINSRKAMAGFTDFNRMIDILKSLNFSNLQTIVFSDRDLNYFDFKKALLWVVDNKYPYLKNSNYNASCKIDLTMNELLSNLPSLADEVGSLQAYCEELNKNNNLMPKLDNIYKVNNEVLNIVGAGSCGYTKDIVSKIFLNFESCQLLYKSKRCIGKELDKVEQDRKKAEDAENKAKERLAELSQEIDKKIEEKYVTIIDMISVMGNMISINDIIYATSFASNLYYEKDVWMKYYNRNKAEIVLNKLYNTVVGKTNFFNHKLPLMKVLSVCRNLSSFEHYDEEIFNIFNSAKEYRPSDFMNDSTFSSEKYNLEKIDGKKGIYNVLNVMESDVLKLFEMHLGYELALFGNFMYRFGRTNLKYINSMIPSLFDCMSKLGGIEVPRNVLNYANKSFCYLALKENDSSSEEEIASMPENGFVREYLEYLCDSSNVKFTEQLYDDATNFEKYIYLVKVSYVLSKIIYCCLNKIFVDDISLIDTLQIKETDEIQEICKVGKISEFLIKAVDEVGTIGEEVYGDEGVSL